MSEHHDDDSSSARERATSGSEGGGATQMGRAHARGSVLLLVGRLLSLGFTVTTQVVVIRALSKADYGVFAYALVLVAAGRVLLSLGQGKLLSRFMSKYEEERDYPRMFGSMLLAVGTITTTSTLLLGTLAFAAGPLLSSSFDDPRAVDVFLVLMFLAPMEALDQVFVSLFAVFSNPRAIFFRKYLLTPGLRLAVVLAIAVLDGTVLQLASGYVLTSLLGLVIYLLLLIQVLRGRGYLRHLHLRRVVLPFREVFSFSVPTLTSELVFLATNMGSVVILGAYWAAAQVAEFRAVIPAARLNQVVYQTFLTLFLPMAARLFARGDRAGLRDAYWQSSITLAVFTFPVFALTGPFAAVTTVTLFGSRYESSGVILMVLAVGYYVSVSLGFNVYVLQVYGRLRFLVVSNICVAAANLGLAFALIPHYGALGAAASNATTMVCQNIVNQVVLNKTMRVGGEHTTGASRVRPYLIICAVTGGLGVIAAVLNPNFFVALAVSLVGSVVVLRLNRVALDLANTFPELMRVPVLRSIIR